MPKIYAPSIPLDFDSKYSYKNTNSTKELVKFHLTNLLLTNPGEKISDYTYGIGAKRFLFQPLTSDILISIQDRIETQIQSHLGYLSTRRVDVIGPDDDTSLSDNSIRIRIQYVIAGLKVSDVLDLEVTQASSPLGDSESGFY